jgi:hypothetical protein
MVPKPKPRKRRRRRRGIPKAPVAPGKRITAFFGKPRVRTGGEIARKKAKLEYQPVKTLRKTYSKLKRSHMKKLGLEKAPKWKAQYVRTIRAMR